MPSMNTPSLYCSVRWISRAAGPARKRLLTARRPRAGLYERRRRAPAILRDRASRQAVAGKDFELMATCEGGLFSNARSVGAARASSPADREDQPDLLARLPKTMTCSA